MAIKPEQIKPNGTRANRDPALNFWGVAIKPGLLNGTSVSLAPIIRSIVQTACGAGGSPPRKARERSLRPPSQPETSNSGRTGPYDPARTAVWGNQTRVAKEAQSVASSPVADALDHSPPGHTLPSRARALRVLCVCLLLWGTPMLGLFLTVGPSHVFFQESVFFSKAAVVTFGGAYAVLSYIAQQAVERYVWLQPGEMLDGLGMAETTPGPLIMVVQFVGFMGAYRHPGDFETLMAGFMGSIITIWVTFVPCFLWIFLGAPFIEALRGKRSLNAALSTITAAVVGVVLNLAIWFGLHTVFHRVDERHVGGLRLLVPDVTSVDVAALALSLMAFVALFRFKVGMFTILAGSAAVGALLRSAAP